MSEVKNVVKYIEISKLSKWDINPRIISDKALSDLKYKIDKYKFFMEARPILVNVKKEKPNEFIVFAGNQRLEAIKQLGWKEAPVVIFNDLSDKEQKELAIIDNHNDGEWKMETLQLHFKEIQFDKLGLLLDFKMPSIVPPVIPNTPSCGKTEEIQIDNSTTKQEQQGYPVSNSMPENNVENLPEPSNEIRNEKRVVKCPHCGKEFEL